MKNQLLFLTLLLLPILARGYDACINDIYYNLDNSTMEASVTYSYQRYSPTYSYKGSIKIPEIVLNNGKEYRVTSIGETAFWTCTGLTSLTLPKSIKKIDMQAFDGCINLTAVHISDLAAWCQINFGLDEGNNPLWFAHHLYLDDKEIIDLCIPDNITYVNSYAFSGGSSITSVSIPNSVTGIGTSAFSGCSSMTSISIPNNITVIESEAFQDCSSLTTVTIPNSVTIIGFGAFNGYINRDL